LSKLLCRETQQSDAANVDGCPSSNAWRQS
jgi:hypothetical protein